MKKRIVVLFLVSVIGISSAFSAFSSMSTSNGRNQVIGNVFFLQTLSENVNASSIGASAFYHNKMSDSIGIYANVGVGNPLAFSFKDVAGSFTNTVAVIIQTGPYYIIPINDVMLVKAGAGINLSLLGAAAGGAEYTSISVGAGAMGSFEYEVIPRINLVGSLTLGLDVKTWLNKAGVTTNTGGIVFNMMPSIGVSYHF